MNNDQKFWLFLWLMLAAVVVSIVYIGTDYSKTTVKYYIDNSYEETAIPGTRYTVWVKIKN